MRAHEILGQLLLALFLALLLVAAASFVADSGHSKPHPAEESP